MENSVQFNEIYWYAKRAKAAYGNETTIRDDFPETVRIHTLPKSNIQYFLEYHSAEALQVVSVRGTENIKNWQADADYVQAKDGKLGIYVHKGFDHATRELYHDVSAEIKKGYRLRTTGHSLGAAVSTLLMMYLQHDGIEIDKSINFGQPKFTNKNGVEKYRSLPLLRVVDENDVVPLVPPVTLVDSIHGRYQHLGPEVILLQDQYYTFVDEQAAEQESIGSFWKDLGHESVKEHFMDNYIKNIEAKLKAATPVPYADRHKYVG